MVSDSAVGLDRTYSAHASGIDDSEGNAKRVMLFGTALLTAIDILIKNSLFKSENSDIRNIALILGHFLNFVHDMKEMCVANEDGWKATVLERADEHEIKPYMISINHIVSEIREGEDDATPDEDGTPRPEIGTRREGLENAAKSYESKPWVGVITLESLKAGVERSWTHWDWATEVRPSQVWPSLFTTFPLTLPIAPCILQSPSCQSRAIRAHLRKEDRWQIL